MNRRPGAFRESLDALKVTKGALLVEVANHGNRNLDLSSRNLKGIELGHQQRCASVSPAAV